MSDEPISKPKFFFFRQRGELGYVAEVSLIIFSILFAFWVERWRETREEDARMEQYMKEIESDLNEEISTSKINLHDCENDIRQLQKILKYADSKEVDSVDIYRARFLGVFYRGVFRTFPPTTIDVMTNNGDLELIRNDSLQKALVSIFSFRTEVAHEFVQFNSTTEESGKILFDDLQLGTYSDFHPDAARLYRPQNTSAIFSLLRRADFKAFMLYNYIEDLEKVKGSLVKKSTQ